jgi:hypothetical protein
MSIYTVHVPVPSAEKSALNPERFIFVRDGFSFWAFLLAPVWMLWHRLWVVFLIYLGLAIFLQIGLHMIGASGMVTLAAGALLALLVGLEAATLRRLTLAWRHWKNVGIVVGEDVEAAERRFFDTWVHDQPRGSVSPAAAVPVPIGPVLPGSATEIVGLFPQPGSSR